MSCVASTMTPIEAHILRFVEIFSLRVRYFDRGL